MEHRTKVAECTKRMSISWNEQAIDEKYIRKIAHECNLFLFDTMCTTMIVQNIVYNMKMKSQRADERASK